MTHRKKLCFKSHTPKSFQKGAVLILMMFILGLAVAAYILKTLNISDLQSAQDNKTYQALKEAKTALISWSISHPNWPGIMPFPDRKETINPNYDGKSDCVTNGLSVNHLLGKLPLMGDSPCISPQQGLSVELLDGASERLWYAVSMNLIRTNGADSTPVINPGIIRTPVHPWLKVLDRNGNPISDRVAVVIIAPGAPLKGQNRSGPAPNPDKYLDNLKIGANPYSNADYDDYDEDFIMGEDSRFVTDLDATLQKPYYFNDKLIYITIDELMFALEKRVAAEVKPAIKNYKQVTGYYPYAAIMGGWKNYSCVNSKLSGALPIVASHSSSCSYNGFSETNSASNCSFSEIDSVMFTKTGANFTRSSGACQFSAKACTCNGQGGCERDDEIFSCDANGACSANIAGSYNFSGGGFDSVVGRCTSSCGSDISCSGIGEGSFTHSACSDIAFNNALTNSVLPPWFTKNLWQDYVYFSVQRGNSPAMVAGGRSGISALVITTGSPITTLPFASKGGEQIRPSCNLPDHMDTAINGSGDVTNIYEPLGKSRSSNYNDQIFQISP